MSKLVDNYCRHMGDSWREGTGEVRTFLGTDVPVPSSALPQWAFYRLPAGFRGDLFHGRLIGESDDLRQKRLAKELKAS